MYRVRIILTGLVMILINQMALSQMKLGDRPYTVQKSAILDMESSNQGLLLVRLSDTTNINLLSPPDGMIIYFTPTNQLYVRSNSAWRPIAFLSGTGFVKASGTTISYDNSTYLTGNQTITLSGDVTGSGATAITTTLANSGVTAGTYGRVTVNSKGLVTAGKRQETYSGTTDASGTYTVTFATAYSVAPNIQVTLVGASDVQSCRVTSITTTGFTVLARSQALGLVFSNATGVNVDVLITEK